MNTTGFRIEYWHDDEVVLLATDVEGEDPVAILAPSVCRLCAQGAGGVVALEFLATGTVVARRAFWPAVATRSPGDSSARRQETGS